MYHVVFRLAGTLPLEAIERLRAARKDEEKRIAELTSPQTRNVKRPAYQAAYIEKFHALLDGSTCGPVWLRDERIAAIVTEAMHYRDGKEYDLLAFCIMPNHVHMVFALPVRQTSVRPQPDCRTEARLTPVTAILRLIKGATARECNRTLHRSGPFWQHESYDHVIRTGDELERTIWYVLNNPVKAGLVESWEQWQWTYVKPEMVGRGRA